MNENNVLWPSQQLLLTADTSSGVNAAQQPSQQLRFLRDLSEFVALSLFAESLVYSTPENNTGWTAFRMGPGGHVAYHHWDQANPNLLQLDAYSLSSLDFGHVLQVVRSAWLPTGQRAFLVGRDQPDSPLVISELSNDLIVRPGLNSGLGPGDHLHLMVDQIARINTEMDEVFLNSAVAELVKQLGMRCMTPVISRKVSHFGSVEYDAIVGITTSHVLLRVRSVEGFANLSLDVFSCREFKPSLVISWLERLFPQTESRRSVLCNRYPLGTFTNLQ